MSTRDQSPARRWLRRLVILTVVSVVVGVPSYIGWRVKRAVDASFAFSSSIVISAEASVFLGDEIAAGRALPSSEAEFVAAFGDYLEQQRSGWPLEQSVAEGWIQYRPPAPDEPLEVDPCADDFILSSDYIDCQSFRNDVRYLIWAIEEASVRSRQAAD